MSSGETHKFGGGRLNWGRLSVYTKSSICGSQQRVDVRGSGSFKVQQVVGGGGVVGGEHPSQESAPGLGGVVSKQFLAQSFLGGNRTPVSTWQISVR